MPSPIDALLLAAGGAVAGALAPTNNAPTAVALTNTVTGINENTPTASRIKVADIVVVDDALGTNVLGLAGADAAFFEIDGTTLYLKAGTVLDYEMKTSYSVVVTADDTTVGSTPDASTPYTLTVGNTVDTALEAALVAIGGVIGGALTPTNQAPSAVVLTNTVAEIEENTPTATRIKVADIAVIDDTLGTNSVALTGADATSFEIVGTSLYLKAGAVLDHETKASYSVAVTADDATRGGTPDASVTFTLTVADVNEPPTLSANTGATVNEGQSVAIGNAQLDFDDVEQTDAQITYTLTSLPAHGTLFRNGVALAIAGTFTQADIANALITYTHNGGETTSDSFGFAVSDGVAAAIAGQFAVTVTPQNDAPAITSNGGGATAAVSIVENTTAVTTVTATDPDGPSLAYSIIGGADAVKFDIDASTGALTFIDAPDFERPGDADYNNSYIVQVRASDGTLSDDQTITVSVTNAPLELALKNDFNADGRADILWQNHSGTPAVWLMNGVDVLAAGPALPNPGASWHAKDAGDFDGDGKADILWQNDNGSAAIWLMDGFEVLAKGPALANPGASWHVKHAGDFDGDGKADILWQNDNGTRAVWLMDGVDILETGPALSNPGASWREKAVADFNGDGNADILWQNDNGAAAVWLMDGANVREMGPALPNPGPGWHAVAAADFDADGKADILWQNDDGTPAVWMMDGVNVRATGPALLNPGVTWHAEDAIDVDGDGHADILWQNDSGAPAVWLMEGVNVHAMGPPLTNPGTGWDII